MSGETSDRSSKVDVKGIKFLRFNQRCNVILHDCYLSVLCTYCVQDDIEGGAEFVNLAFNAYTQLSLIQNACLCFYAHQIEKGQGCRVSYVEEVPFLGYNVPRSKLTRFSARVVIFIPLQSSSQTLCS